MAPESISKVLADNNELRPLADRLVLIKRLQRRYRTLAPEQLAQASRVCAIDGTTVVILATSGPVAAALRQIAPRLLQGLRETRLTSKHPRDQELNAIRIEVQVADAPRKRVVTARAPLPRDKLSAVARGLTDSPLKEALEAMAGDQMIKRTRSKT